MNNWVPTASVLPRNSFLHSSLVSRQCSLTPEKNFGKLPCQIPNSSSCFDIPLLHVQNLSISFSLFGKKISAVRNVSFSLNEGERVGIVGESGSGKSCTVQAIPRLLPQAEIQGTIDFEGKNLLQLKEKELNKIRGKKIGISFQEMGASLNPTMTIGKQIEEALSTHKFPKEKALSLLELVEMPRPQAILKCYPHELSGGMKQRVSLSLALACSPKLLIADEPTTALDPKTKEQILSLLKRKEIASSLLLVSHDLHLVANICERILIFYQGEMIEEGKTDEILKSPKHPYTQGLLSLMRKYD